MIKLDSHIAESITTFQFPENVTSSILDFLINTSTESYRKNRNLLHNIVLDFSKIKYIEIDGALAVICFCAAIKRKNSNANFEFIYPPERVFNYLITLGFFGQMSNKVGVMQREDIVHLENEIRNERRIRMMRNSNKVDPFPVVLPIETITQQINSIGGADFENMVGTFANHVIGAFDILENSPHYNFSGEDYYKFRQSNIELYKNIFHHSESWGITSIHARPNHGTTVCYFDLGIGFKASVKKFATEVESIEWALIDGNTSKPDDDNDGYGFTLVQEFIFKRKGSLKIRSGDCMIQLSSSSTRKKSKVSTFPGVQISFFIPA